MLKVVAFDLDDTLLYTYERVHAKIMRVAELLDMAAPTAASFHAGYTSGDPAQALRDWFPQSPFDEVTAVYEALRPDFVDVALPGFADLTDQLRASGLTVGVLSNSPRHKLARKLGHLAATSRLDFALAGEDLPAPKPSPLCFEPVFESCRITPAELLYVGDARGDWRAATDAGVGFVRMYRPWQQWSAPAVTTVRELTEVAAVALA